MPRVNRKKLDDLIETAGVDSETAEQLREANEGKKSDRPKGHGVATPDLHPIEL